MNDTFIGVIARRAGVPIKTIRYYEEVGLLPKPARTASRYRVYPSEAVDRLHFIKKAQNLGLRLKDIREILDLADRGRCPCGHVQRLLKARLGELREKMAAMRMLEHRLKDATARGCPPSFRPRGKAICPTIQDAPHGRGVNNHARRTHRLGRRSRAARRHARNQFGAGRD